MSRKIKLILITFLSLILFVCLALYLLLCFYYRNGFSYNTWINGVYCTGKSIDEINNELNDKNPVKPLEVTDLNGLTEYIYPEEICFTKDYTDSLKNIFDNQNPFLWIKNFSGKNNQLKASADISFDENLLKERIKDISLVKEYMNAGPDEVSIILSDEGYELKNSHPGRIDEELVFKAISDCLFKESDFKFDESFIQYSDYSEDELLIISDWESTSDYFGMNISIDLGNDKINLDRKILSSFVSLDKNGLFLKNGSNLYINDDIIRDFVNDIGNRLNTYKDSRDFVTHSGETKTIDLVMYGTMINVEDLAERVVLAVHEGKEAVIVPEYIKEAYVKGLDDIGPDYVEIDLGRQVLYYYKNGELNLETDIVSGKPSTPTPAMVTKVCSKSRNVVLRGRNYESFVNYWVPIYPKEGIGLHDASWQSEYGGERYLRHGSHGCINMQKDAITYLYDELVVGMPVIVYY